MCNADGKCTDYKLAELFVELWAEAKEQPRLKGQPEIELVTWVFHTLRIMGAFDKG